MSDPARHPPLDAGQIEIWKKIVDVQQHFNDLELRIRNFALIVTGAFLGLGGYAIKDGGMFDAFGIEVSLAGLIVVSAILPLLAFYFMDRLWYHRLLDGSVKAGIEAETALKALGYKVDLGTQISKKSPFILWFTKKPIHSKSKMDLFYLMLVLALLIVGFCLGFGISPRNLSPEPTEISKVDEDGSMNEAALPADNSGVADQASVNEIDAVSSRDTTIEPDD
jgi:hypothetical protein